MAGARLAIFAIAAVLSLSEAQASWSFKKVFEITLEDSGELRTLQLVFHEEPPPPAIVDKMMRQTLEEAVEIDPTKNILAVAFFPDVESDENRYSDQLIFDASKHKIMTFDEYDGVKIATYESANCFVKVSELKTAKGITPERKWIEVFLVFASEPTQDAAYKAIEEEAQKLLSRGLDMNLYVAVGDKNVKTSWIQMRDREGGYIYADYDAASKRLTHDDQLLKQL